MAQSGTVVGTVTDSQNGEQQPDANILIAGTDSRTTTNLSGEYSLNVDGPGVELVFHSSAICLRQ